jgi:hypothetical protein
MSSQKLINHYFIAYVAGKDKTNTAYTATRMDKVMDIGYVQNHSQLDKGLRWIMSFHL